MTFGPIEPSITGNSIDLPVALSVNVIDPVTAPTFVLLPSMDHLDLTPAGGWPICHRIVAGVQLSNAVRILQCNIASARKEALTRDAKPRPQSVPGSPRG